MNNLKKMQLMLCLLWPFVTCNGQGSSTVLKIAQIFEEVSLTIEQGGSVTRLRDLSEKIDTYNLCPVPKGLLVSDSNNQELELGEHLVFLPEIIDSLAKGSRGHEYALEAYGKFSRKKFKGSTSDVFDACVETKVIRAQDKHVFELKTRGEQHVAVVAEQYGRLSLLIHDESNNCYRVERDKETSGKLMRYLSYSPPKLGMLYTLRIEVENRSEFDISYVIILN